MLRTVLFSLMAVGLLGFGFLTWRSMHQPPPTPNRPHIAAAQHQPPVTVAVVVAAHDLTPGAFLKAGDITSRRLPANEIPAGAIDDTPQQRTALSGALVWHAVPGGQPVIRKDVLLSGGQGFLAALLSPGMRAFTIGQDSFVSASGFIVPGDHVDLILVASNSQESGSGSPGGAAGGQGSGTGGQGGGMEGRAFVAQTVLTNVRVLAVDQQLVQGAPPDPAKHTGFTSLCVEVSPAGAERLAVALRLGKLALVVRPATADSSNGAAAMRADPAPPAIWSGNVMSALQSPTDGHGAIETVHVFEGSHSSDFNF